MYKARAYAGIGSRATPVQTLAEMEAIAMWLADEQWTLRSGAAEGADTAFEKGAIEHNGRREIYLPWPMFNHHHSNLEPKFAAYGIAEQFHPAWDKLSQGAKKLMARNVHQIAGPALRDPVHMVICWTPEGRVTGGTGLALRIAEHENIPIINLGGMSLTEVEARIRKINESTKP